MTSREALIARKLSGLPFVMSPDVHEEIRQSIADYFLDDTHDSDSELSTSDAESHDANETTAESSHFLATTVTTSLMPNTASSPPASVSVARQASTPTPVFVINPAPIPEAERNILGVGVHSLGDEGQSGVEEKEKEVKLVEEMQVKKCCSNNCLAKIPIDTIISCREQCRELQVRCDQHVDHLHLILLGHFDACLQDSKKTSSSKKKPTDRSRTRLMHTFHGMPVCIDSFHFLHDISRRVTRNLKLQFEQYGLEPSAHGNVLKTSLSKALPFEMRCDVVKFIENYALSNALVLPGRTAGTKNPDILLLPCGTTKSKVHTLYVQACGDNRSMSFAAFTATWRMFLPGICIQKPRTDLCSTCKQQTVSLQKLRSLDEDVRKDLLSQSLKHLEVVSEQRQYYKDCISNANIALPPQFQFGQVSDSAVVQHFSFDFAQQVFIPNSSQQVGPIYFLVPYKLALFGIMCEPMSRMVIYIIPEAVLVSKGSNLVISLLHHFLSKYAAGVTQMVFNADNCVGQNKNNTVLQYLMWRVVTGLSSRIELAFMISGHTKFGPDYGFGIFKRLYRHAEVNSVDEVCNLMSGSKLLIAEPVGTEQGEVRIPCYDWQSKFASLGKISGIKQNHHFSFDRVKPNVCSVRTYAQSAVAETTVDWDNESMSSEMPEILIPAGLSHARKEYLYAKIRKYVSNDMKDRLCPKPADAVEDMPETSAVQKTVQPTVVPVKEVSSRKAKQVAGRSLLTRSVAATSCTEQIPTTMGLSMPHRKRAAPTCGYCGVQGHRDSFRSGKPLCPKRKAECGQK